MKHPQAPWIIKKEGRGLFIRGGEHGKDAVCDLEVDEFSANDPQVMADASLIAAAPELYHAAKLVAAYFRDYVRTEKGKQYAGYLTALNKAILKAEGKE